MLGILLEFLDIYRDCEFRPVRKTKLNSFGSYFELCLFSFGGGVVIGLVYKEFFV